MSRRTHLPSGLFSGLDFLIDTNWSPQQALAVYELLDDLRARILMRYGDELHELMRQQRQHPPDVGDILDRTDPF
ncbi:hypothetical protein BZM27_39750 [Paraburkholderia steynii]|uniref:Uncharacterized protein n=1 Tax=Paraburkholderia steynii TaxID=1245441 RepID=A0A4R0X6Y9_9BURK|nr:hypothetical protein BZM27_39750 [Paraburkholderia steynii]